MYPLCCIDIRNFLNQIYLFSDDHFQSSSVIDETLRIVRQDVHPHRMDANGISHSTSYSATKSVVAWSTACHHSIPARLYRFSPISITSKWRVRSCKSCSSKRDPRPVQQGPLRSKQPQTLAMPRSVPKHECMSL